MRILILGGTGAIGKPLVQLLGEKGYDIFVTSRIQHETKNKICYIQGNAHNMSFLHEILTCKYDVIIDFMVYTVKEFSERLQILLNATNQYIFFSSGRVYADSISKITEESPRLLDVSNDTEYLTTNEYSLAKARQEDLLRESQNKNWTIIRPYITYNNERLQLGVLEKEQWLYRALHGRTILFSRDMASKLTTLTYGYDVAKNLLEIIGRKTALGEIIHIASPQAVSWDQILMIYLNTIEEITGKRPKIHYLDSSEGIKKVLDNIYQIQYDRLYNRIFDSSKANKICQKNLSYSLIEESLRKCLKEFIEEQKKFKNMNWRFEAYLDKTTGEKTPLHEIPKLKQKIKYLLYRYSCLL